MFFAAASKKGKSGYLGIIVKPTLDRHVACYKDNGDHWCTMHASVWWAL